MLYWLQLFLTGRWKRNLPKFQCITGSNDVEPELEKPNCLLVMTSEGWTMTSNKSTTFNTIVLFFSRKVGFLDCFPVQSMLHSCLIGKSGKCFRITICVAITLLNSEFMAYGNAVCARTPYCIWNLNKNRKNMWVYNNCVQFHNTSCFSFSWV